jgi:hypothetical protein
VKLAQLDSEDGGSASPAQCEYLRKYAGMVAHCVCGTQSLLSGSIMTKRRFQATFPALLLLAPFLLTACAKRSSVSPETGGGSQAGPSAKGTPSPEPAFKLTADAFDEESQKNIEAAAQKYLGKWVELTGKVNFVGEYSEKKKERTIGLGPQGSLCYCRVTQAERLPGQFSLGQTVRIKVLVGQKFTRNFELTQGEVVDLGPSQLMKVTAEELGKDFAADKPKAEAKYKDKTLILSGTVSKVVPTPLYVGEKYKTKNFLALSTVPGINLVCETNFAGDPLAEKLKVGDSVMLSGFVYNFGVDKGKIRFYNFEVMPK